MGALFAGQATRTLTKAMGKVDPISKKVNTPTLDAERNFRRNIMGTNTPDPVAAPSQLNEINTPGITKRRNGGAAPASPAVKSLLGQ